MPKLSIITINLNNASGLERTINSVISQTFQEYEYIVIDGGSEDKSIDIIKINEQYLNYWISEKDVGIYNAMNKGIKKSCGEYLLFLNSGDTLLNQNILRNIFNCHQDQAELLYGDIKVKKDGVLCFGSSVPEKITLEYMINSSLMHPATFIKKCVFDKFGLYNENLKIASDYEFFLRTTILNPISSKRIPFAVTYFDSNGMSSKKENSDLNKSERSMVLRNNFPGPVLDLIYEYLDLKKYHSNLRRNNYFRILKKLKLISKF